MEKKPDKVFTLCFVFNDSNEVLLMEKKSRLGKKLLNGPGGHVREGKDKESEAKRELKTECGLTAIEMRQIGFLIFKFLDSGKDFHCYIYLVTKSEGNVKESTEMGSPRWVERNMETIPFNLMWQGDKLWFPYLLREEDFHGWILYNNTQEKKVVNHRIAAV